MTHWSARLLADQLGSRSPRWLFGIITRQAIRPGTFTSVKDLIAGIEAFIDGCNERCHPSSGPKPPTKSSPKPTVNKLQPRDASVLRLKFVLYIW